MRVLCAGLLFIAACDSASNEEALDASQRLPRFPAPTDAGLEPDAGRDQDAASPVGPCPSVPTPEIILSLPDTVGLIRPFGEHVYFTATPGSPPLEAQSWVGRLPLEGGPVEVLALDEYAATGIAVDATGVYWSNFGEDTSHPLANQIRMLPGAGGPPLTLWNGRAFYLETGGRRLFFSTQNGLGEGEIHRIEIPAAPGVRSTVLATFARGVQFTDLNGLEVTARAVYWLEHRPEDRGNPARDAFIRMSHGSTVAETVLELSDVNMPVTDDEFVYFRGGATRPGYWRHRIAASELELLAETEEVAIFNTISVLADLIPDESALYVSTVGSGSSVYVHRIPYRDAEPTCLILEDIGFGDPNVLDLQVQVSPHLRHLYYRRGPNEIARVPR